MNLITIIAGILVISFGMYTTVIRFIKPEKFSKLQSMRETFGDKVGLVIHVIGYSILPIIIGIIFVYLGFTGVSIL